MAYVPPHKRRSQEGKGCSEGSNTPFVSNDRTPRKENYSRFAYNSTAQLPPVFEKIALYYCINLSERQVKWRAFQERAMRVHNEFAGLVKRFDAVNGKAVLSENRCNEEILKRVWDASMNAKYSSKAQPGTKTMSDGEVGCALSHVELWKILTSTESSSENPVMMVLEDDAVFSSVAVDLDSQMCWRKLWRTFRVAGAFSTWDFLAEENGIT
jgi:GR25 family glycosyltransferase involved in LPS biosynthesis